MTPSAVFCPQLNWFEPLDIFAVEEHETNDGGLAVHLERGSAQHGSFDRNAIRIYRHDGSTSNQDLRPVLFLTKRKYRGGREDNRGIHCSNHHRLRPKEALVLKDE